VNEQMLVPEVQARRTLHGRRLRLSMLAPYGSWLGCGTLRVLRVRTNDDDSVDLTVGYESYERVAGDARGAAAS
jgi:hypothetical protein